MPQDKPQFEVIDEFNGIAKKIVEKYHDVFDGIDYTQIRCVALTNRERKQGAKYFSILPVKMPIRMDTPYGWYATIFAEDWTAMDEAHKNVLVFSVLCAIPQNEEDEGKVNPFDLKDYDIIVRNFSVDYMTRADLPDILKDDVKLTTKLD